MIPVDVELAHEAKDRAVNEIIGIITELTKRNMGTDGYTFGTEHMSREDRMLMFLDDAKSGALDHLKVLNEKAYIAYLRQFNSDLKASAPMQPQGVR